MEKLVPYPFIKNQNWAYLWINNLKCYKCLVCSSRGLPKYIKTKMLTTSFYLIESFFKKIRELVSFPHFLHGYWRKIFFTLYFINWTNFIAWLPFPLEILGNMCTVLICCSVCDAIKFEANLSFLIEPFFYITKKSGQKCIYISRTKELLT